MPVAPLVNRETGEREFVDVSQVDAALASGKYIAPDAVAVHRFGADTYATPGIAQREQVFTPAIDPARAALAEGHAIRERANSGIGAGIKAFAGGAVSGATAGLLDPYADEQEFNRVAAGAGNVAGIIAPALLGDEAGLAGLGRYLPSNAIAGAGTRIGESLGGGLLARSAAGAAEGGLYAAGQGVGEALRSDEPLDLERAMSSIGSNMLFGAKIGGVAGGVSSLAERALGRANSAIDGAIGKAKDAEGAIAAPVAGAETRVIPAAAEGDSEALIKARAGQDFPDDHSDLLTMNEDQLAAAHAKEVESLANFNKADSEAFTDSAKVSRKRDQADQVWNAVRGATDRGDREIAKVYLKADRAIDRVLDNPIALAENPGKLRGPLQQQQHALNELERIRSREAGIFDDDVEHAHEIVRAQILAKQVPGEIGPFSPTGLDLAVEREIGRRFGDLANPTKPARLLYLEKVPKALERNKILLADLDRLGAEPTSIRLRDIEAKMEELGAHIPETSTLGHDVLKAALPFAGPLGAIASHGMKALGGLRFAARKVATKTGEAVSSFLDSTIAAGKYAPVLATETLSKVRFAPVARGTAGIAEDSTLPALFKARTSEIKSQTAYDATGTPRMTPEARGALSDRFRGIRVVDAKLADQLETIAARRIEFLSRLIPRRPDFGTPQIGPDRWQASDMAMRSWARSVAAAEDPAGVEERAVHGALTPEDVAAYWAIYPERAQDFQQQLASQLPTLKHPLPYQRRLSLGMLAGMPIDPSMHPRVVAVLQGQFPDEPGSAGGTQAPMAAPQFGSIKKSIDSPTPAQARAQGAHAA